MLEVLIYRDENLESFSFRLVEQVTVFQRRPSAFVCGRDFVLDQ